MLYCLANGQEGSSNHNTIVHPSFILYLNKNIGHSIIARAVISGLDEAVRSMRALMDQVTGTGV